MATTTSQQPSATKKEQSWEVAVPTDPFWSTFKGTTAKNYMMSYPSEERAGVTATLDNSLTRPEKLDFLRSTLEKRLKDKDLACAPSTFREADKSSWSGVILALISVSREQDDIALEEDLSKQMLAAGHKSALQTLCDVYTRTGRLAEAEVTGRECRAWMDGHDLLGPSSPQSISMTCGIARSVGWQAGRADEARELFREAFRRNEGMKEDKRWADFYDYSNGIVTLQQGEWEAAYAEAQKAKQDA